jgi:nitric oxide reductase activation protein
VDESSLDESSLENRRVNAFEYDSYQTFAKILTSLRAKAADVSTTLACVEEIYALLQQHPDCDRVGFRTSLPADVGFRGLIEPEQVMINLQLAELDDEDLELLSDELEDKDEEGLSIISMLAADDLDVDKLKQGELDQPGTLLTDLDEREIELDEENKSTEEKVAQGLKAALEGRIRPPHQYQFQYDEWDFVIGDYRRNWCTLHEYRVMDEDPAYVDDALSELGATASNVRRQLNKLRPEMLVKVKGVDDGEELDIERTIELLVDRRAGVATEDRIYVEKQRKQRDVAALFLLDMSASTDDAITPQMMGLESPEAPTLEYDDRDFLHDGYEGPSLDIIDSPKRKIIDVEKEAAILMAEALKNLGDQYAICGFSGYGRDNVDFYVCKDFDEPYGLQAKGKLGGIKACRSTRMGPAIRHATKMLVETGCKTKALIIISDGYPQDFDYGKDRSSKSYGIKDTTRALVEAQQRDVQGFCLTVDQSGHDYLREMCPDKQYMVIQDVDQLPGELSKIYRMITG